MKSIHKSIRNRGWPVVNCLPAQSGLSGPPVVKGQPFRRSTSDTQSAISGRPVRGGPALRGQPVYTEAALIERQVCHSEAYWWSRSVTWSNSWEVGQTVVCSVSARIRLTQCVQQFKGWRLYWVSWIRLQYKR